MSLREQILRSGLPSSARNRPNPQSKRDFSTLDWQEFFDEKRLVSSGTDDFNVYLKGSSGPIFYFLHGGGYSGLTWACIVESLCSYIDCRVLAPDLRGHGCTTTTADHDLSKEKQIEDIANIFREVYGNGDGVPVCIVGHSMGGALAVHAVHANVVPNVVGLIVIDVVEGSAMDALTGMLTFLRGRPSSFDSEEAAVKWCLQSGTAKSNRSARVSMPAQIVKKDDKYTWRIDLSKTSEHWPDWFRGLSTTFLATTPPKMLVLAGVDRLDKDLTIGQMQGKFQTTVLPRVGHAVHEDSPDQLAEEVARFAVRYKFATLKDDAPSALARPAMRLGHVI